MELIMSTPGREDEIRRVMSNPEGRVIMSESLSKIFGENSVVSDSMNVEVSNSADSFFVKGRFIKLERKQLSKTNITVRLNSQKLVSLLPEIALGDNIKAVLQDQEFFGELAEYSIQAFENENTLVDFCFCLK